MGKWIFRPFENNIKWSSGGKIFYDGKLDLALLIGMYFDDL